MVRGLQTAARLSTDCCAWRTAPLAQQQRTRNWSLQGRQGRHDDFRRKLRSAPARCRRKSARKLAASRCANVFKRNQRARAPGRPLFGVLRTLRLFTRVRVRRQVLCSLAERVVREMRARNAVICRRASARDTHQANHSALAFQRRLRAEKNEPRTVARLYM